MNFDPSEEKAKPFWLVKYFTITSLIVIFVGALILSMLNTYWALVLPGVANGFSIFLLKGFFDTLPEEI